MKKILLVILLFGFGINISISQVTYISEDNTESNWEDNLTWSKSETWADDNPGTNLGGATDDVIIYGYVTRSGNLTVGGDIRLIVNDTLVVTGDVNAAGGSSIIVNNEGLLVIFGDLATAGGLDFDNIGNGIVAVGGEFSASGGANIETNEQFYLYDDNPNFNGGASINGEDPRGNPENEFKNDSDLENDYPILKQFIDSNGSSPLPIELKSFTAKLNYSAIQLDWVTAKEENFSHFEVERSVDTENFEMIGLVQGQGESLSDVYYDLEDANAPFGVIYYRLKAVDIDDTFEYSPVVKIENGFNGQASVYPNPADYQGSLQIKVPINFEGDIQHIGIYDLQGAKMQEYYNYDPSQKLNIDNQIKAGLYLLKIQHNGIEENIRVLIK